MNFLKNIFSSSKKENKDKEKEKNSSSKKENEVKSKMEEDPCLEMNVFIEDNKSIDKKFSNDIEKIEIELNKLFSIYDPQIKEIDYKYFCKVNSIKKSEEFVKIDKDSIKSIDNIEKMKSIGKLYFKKNSKFTKYSDKVDSTFFNSRFEAQENFPTISSENCVYKGHWCFEVTLITNGLFQIGFSQLNTICNRTSGVGDGLDSYAYDGYRITSWNKLQKKYGKPWDIGDVIGVCIDLEEQTIEYFLNGETLGIAFKNIPIGPNITYFPSVTFSNTQKCYVNVGQFKFKYDYKNNDGT